VPPTPTAVKLTLNEQIALADAPLVAPPAVLVLNEGVGVQDGPTPTPGPAVSIAEDLSISDAEHLAPPGVIGVTESIHAADSAIAVPPAAVQIAESSTLADAVLFAPPARLSLAEALSEGDAISATTVDPVAPPSGGTVKIVQPGTHSDVESPDNSVDVAVPSGAIDSVSQVEYKPKPASSAPTPPAGTHLLKAFELNLFDAQGHQVQSPHFKKPLTIRVKYTQADLNAVNGDASRLRVTVFLTSTNSWQTLNTTVDAAHHELVANVNHFTLFGVQSQPPAVTPTPAPAETPTPRPTLTPTPTPPLTVVPVTQVTPVPANSGVVVLVQPNQSATVNVPGTGVTLRFPSSARQASFQARVSVPSSGSVHLSDGDSVFGTVEVELFDAEGNPLQDTNLWHPATLSFALSDAQLAKVGGAAAVQDAFFGNHWAIWRVGPEGGVPLDTSYDPVRHVFTAEVGYFSTYALVNSAESVPPSPTASASATSLPTPSANPTPTAILPSTGGRAPGRAVVWMIVLLGSALAAGGIAAFRRMSSSR